MEDEATPSNVVELATELTIAWLSNPNTRADTGQVPEFLKTMYSAVEALVANGPAEEPAQEHVPAVTARRSLASKDHILSMIDGKPYKTLRRHLSRHGMTPQDYRDRYGLKRDYPMVAPAYADMRRDMAKKIGLGRKGRPSDEGPADLPPSDGLAAASAERPAAAPKVPRKRKPQTSTGQDGGAAPVGPKRRGRPRKEASNGPEGSSGEA